MHARDFLRRQYSLVLLNADKDGSGGAGTLKQQLEASEGKVTKLDADLKALGEKVTKLGDDLKTSGEKVTKLESDLKAAGENATKLEGELKTEKERATKLEADLKAEQQKNQTVDERAREKAARHGAAPVRTDGAANQPGSTNEALYEQYAAMKPGREKSAFFRENEKALMAYARELGKQAA